jgi:uncharacterized protein
MSISWRRFGLGAFAVLFAAAVARTVAMTAVASVVGMQREGFILGAGILAGACAGLAVLLWVAAPARAELLGLKRVPLAGLLLWFLAGAALIGAVDLAASVLGRPLLPPEWVSAGKSAPPLLLPLALAVTSIFEELFLRGFFQGGLAKTRLGPWGALAVTALLFSALHFPQDAFRFADVFLGGTLLGLARHHTGSAYAGMAPHVAGNLKVLAMIALA